MASNKRDLEKTRPRNKRTGTFASDYSDFQLIELLRAVAREAQPDDPERITQATFDRHAPALAKSRGWPAPPSARAIQMRLGDTNQKRGWRALVAESLVQGRDPVQHAAFKRRAPHDRSLDEGVIHYALRRVAEHLGRTPTADEYDRAVIELIEVEQRRRRDSILEELLPTSGQIIAYAGPAGWEGALALARLAPRPKAEPVRGIDPVSLAWHYYETKLERPRYAKELRAHARELGILLRDLKAWTIGDALVELERRRRARGWSTPAGAPPEDERLTPFELHALIANAALIPERWTLTRALDCLVEYLDEFEHERGALRSKHYNECAVGRVWPPFSALQTLGKKEGISTWAAWLEAARRHRVERDRRAA